MNLRLIRGLLGSFGPSLVLNGLLAGSVLLTASGWRPRSKRGRARLLRPLLTVGALAPWAYTFALRPWHLTWGATDEEVAGVLPGDALIRHPVFSSTRAITLDAPAREVWPWLMQLGQGRGGFYSYDWLENLAGLDIHSVDRVLPELQDLKVGDLVRSAPEAFGPEAGFRVAAIEPERALLLHIRSGEETVFSWVFALESLDAGTTRLLVRSRLGGRPRLLSWSLYTLLIELPHFFMERRQLLGIQQRVEAAAREGRALPVRPEAPRPEALHRGRVRPPGPR